MIFFTARSTLLGLVDAVERRRLCLDLDRDAHRWYGGGDLDGDGLIFTLFRPRAGERLGDLFMFIRSRAGGGGLGDGDGLQPLGKVIFSAYGLSLIHI